MYKGKRGRFHAAFLHLQKKIRNEMIRYRVYCNIHIDFRLFVLWSILLQSGGDLRVAVRSPPEPGKANSFRLSQFSLYRERSERGESKNAHQNEQDDRIIDFTDPFDQEQKELVNECGWEIPVGANARERLHAMWLSSFKRSQKTVAETWESSMKAVLSLICLAESQLPPFTDSPAGQENPREARSAAASLDEGITAAGAASASHYAGAIGRLRAPGCCWPGRRGFRRFYGGLAWQLRRRLRRRRLCRRRRRQDPARGRGAGVRAQRAERNGAGLAGRAGRGGGSEPAGPARGHAGGVGRRGAVGGDRGRGGPAHARQARDPVAAGDPARRRVRARLRACRACTRIVRARVSARSRAARPCVCVRACVRACSSCSPSLHPSLAA